MVKLTIAFLMAMVFTLAPVAIAADHRDAPGANEDPVGDINDVYAFVDPTDSSRMIVAMTVFPLAVPQLGGYAFGRDILYQIKIDNDGDAKEDFVVQMVCTGVGASQNCRVWGPVRPTAANLGVRNKVIASPSINGTINTVFGDATAVQAFAGLREDAFVFDVGQFNRIINTGTQDAFREVNLAALGVTLRGRPVASGRSGFDGFGGFNTLAMVVGFPKALVRGSGSKVNIWGTTSRQVKEELNQDLSLTNRTFLQFERMGQAAFNTVFIDSSLKDHFNSLPPDQDMDFGARFVPDALTSNDTTGNTIAGRATVLGALGLTSAPNGAPLLLPASFTNTNKDLLRVALLPDVIRLDLDLPSGDLAIGQFGLANGRRPGDDMVDILLQVARQLADVTFPEALGVPGSGPRRPGSLDFPGDRRVFAVLQGTDFIKPDSQLLDFSVSGNDRAFGTAFPYFGAPHPSVGEPGTVGFPHPPTQ